MPMAEISKVSLPGSSMKLSKPSVKVRNTIATPNWDFGQSLWDSCEILTVAKKLEAGLVLDGPFTGLEEDTSTAHKRRKESRNSLRNLFKPMFSRRFNEADIPREDKNGF
ncbi:uncharacterized protein LOC111285954 [Durio zibethinus]|uniref:Uncharacterized protein LOC111285954 n=1 Tax=Durio zibethinus TaxID=66656 RepID=A0A6P5XTZ0_DURZI|nr:uncharacterized protein LOC111285954 [Durio zibethinus]